LDVPRPKETWTTVTSGAFTDWLGAPDKRRPTQLKVFLGLDELGNPIDISLAEGPHIFVAGTTGSGKSRVLHAMIASLICTQKPEDVELALIDPKQVELAIYEKCGRLFRNAIAYDAHAAMDILSELVVEMEGRYQTFRTRGFADWSEALAGGLRLPRIIVFVEELADLLLQEKDSERTLVQLAQKARAAGIHLVLATQRPDAHTFTGLLRSNIPARIALTVQKSSESKIILDETGAESLLGAGDMLVKASPGQPPRRAHGVLLERSFLLSILKTA
jgi:S-DNA-T family DNA segregation ATPase FtsK/SpoIIIE